MHVGSCNRKWTQYTDGRISIVVYTKCLWEQISQTAQHDIKKRKQNGAEEDWI
jgi:hypothetical protein